MDGFMLFLIRADAYIFIISFYVNYFIIDIDYQRQALYSFSLFILINAIGKRGGGL
jgi:hypothetical protein